ncbi:MAG: NfeD family protein, partial [Phycisphaerae bacterium]
FYKIIWSMVKANSVQTDDRSEDWKRITEALKHNIKEFDAETLSNILVMMTRSSEGTSLFQTIEMDLIKNLDDVKTVAWVNPNAHSAGAMIAVACDEIVMARSSRIGDSQVIMFGPDGASEVPEEIEAKATTPVLHEFRTSAKLHGYDPILSEAFVFPDREVWWMENLESGERDFVFRAEKMKRLGETFAPRSEKSREDDAKEMDDEPDRDERMSGSRITPRDRIIVDPDFEPEWKLVETYFDPVVGAEIDLIQPVVRDDQLLEMSPGEAYAFGFSKAVVKNDEELKAQYGLKILSTYEQLWSESLAFFMTSIYVRGFLMFVIMMGLYVEFHTPGVGVAGMTSLLALAILVVAPYLTGLANIWELIFVGIGVALMMLEAFVIPGFGVAGIAGLLFFLVGVLATFVPDEPGRTLPFYIPTMTSTIDALKMGVMTMFSSLVASVFGMVVLSRILPKTTLFAHIAPANPTPADVMPDDTYRGAARVGDIGTAQTPLRPAGKATFGNVLVDVMSEGDFIDSNASVEVVERQGNVVVVREAGTGR